MGHKKARKRKQQAAADGEPQEQAQRREPYSNAHGQDPARALVATTADGALVAAACGSSLRVFSQRTGGAAELPEAEQQHPIRALSFDPSGTLLLAAGDDKTLRVWRCSDWRLLLRVVAAKRISAAAFAADSRHVFLADKFGDVLTAPVPQEPASGDVADTKPAFLLGHFSSIVPALVPSADGRWLASSDREGKARVSILPAQLEQGAPCIRSFCMGHASFITAAAWLGAQRLLTASGDGTLRLWDAADGRQLDAFNTTPHTQAAAAAVAAAAVAAAEPQETAEEAAQAGASEDAFGGDSRAGDAGAGPAQAAAAAEAAAAGPGASEAGGSDGEGAEIGRRLEELPPAVLALGVLPARQEVTAAVEGEDALFLLSYAGDRLQLTGRPGVPGVRLPNSLAVDGSGRLLAAAGCAGRTPLTLGFASLPSGGDPPELEAYAAQLRPVLGASAAVEAPADPDLDSPGLQVSLELRKWVYSEKEMARRKRNRADLRERE